MVLEVGDGDGVLEAVEPAMTVPMDLQLEGVALVDVDGSADPSLLSFRKGDRVVVTAVDGLWLYGECGAAKGYFPADAVELA